MGVLVELALMHARNSLFKWNNTEEPFFLYKDDITRRFEQLERQWLSFRKRGPCLESGKEALPTTAAKVSTAIICTETSSVISDTHSCPSSPFQRNACELNDRVTYELQPPASGAIKTDQHDSYFNRWSRPSSPDTTHPTQDKPDGSHTDSWKQFCKMLPEKEQHTLCENNCVFGKGNDYKPCMQCFQNARMEDMSLKPQFNSGSNAAETGVVLLNKLCMALKDILKQLECKDKMLCEKWNEIRQSSKVKDTKLGALGFKPDFSFEIGDPGLGGISLLAGDMNVDNWSNVITTICQRLLTYMNKETELQQWAMSLEEIAVKLLQMEEDFAKAKASVAEQTREAEMLMKNAEESSHMAKEERESLAREKENLGQWITHLQEQQKVVSECEKEATLSITEVQKRAAELSARESSVDAKTLEISSLKEEIRVATQQLQEEEASLKKERLLTREKMELAEAKQKEAHCQLLNMEKMQEEIKFEREQLEKERMSHEHERQKATLLTKETEERLTVKERILNAIEQDLEGKVLAAEAMAKKLNSREKVLKNFQKQIEEERFQTRELITKLEHEKKSLEDSKKEADEAWACIAQEREGTAVYIKNVDEKTKLWEERLKAEENKLQQEQKFLRDLKNQFKGEQENYQELKKKWLKEQELVAEELKSREEALNKQENSLEIEKQQFKIDLEKLAADKLIAAEAVKKLEEKDTEMEALEKELQKRQQEHILQVEVHENEYKARFQDLETIEKHLQQRNFELERRYQELRLEKKELKQWKKEAEAALDSQIEGFIKEKEDLDRQKQMLVKAGIEIEQTGAHMIDHMMKLDKASTKLENLRHQLDSMQEKLRIIVDGITYRQRALKDKEVHLHSKENEMVSTQNLLKNLEYSLKTESQSLQTRIVEFERQAAAFEQKAKDQLQVEGIGVNRKIHHGGYLDTEGFNYSECAAKSVGEQGFGNMGETAAWVNQTENLKVQHHQLEETRRAIEAAKSTLGAQLKATQQMVSDASLAAQKTSRERVALEEERRLLAKARKEMEMSIASQETKLSLEAKQLESIRNALELEKTQAMQVIQKSEQQKKASLCYESNTNKTYNNENSLDRARSGASVSPAEDSQDCEESPSKAQSIHSSLICKTCSDVWHRLPSNAENERSPDLEHGTASLWHGLDCTKLKWEEVQDNDEINNMQGNGVLSFENGRIEPKEGYFGTQLVLAPCKEVQRNTLQCSGSSRSGLGIADMSSLSTLGSAFDKDNYQGINTSLGLVEQRNGTMEKHNSSMVNVPQKSHAPSQKRLENVMESLGRARKASRNRLQRTEIAISAFPAASAAAADVKQALEVLASRLNSMEQMEDELAYQLVAAYASNPPDSEGMIVDKVQLLCRMEEQQTLRAEWEEEMQKQLEKISSLQAMPCAPLCFNTPIKQTVYDRLYSPQSLKESLRFTGSESWQSQRHTFDRVPQDPNRSCELNNLMHVSYPPCPEWNLSQGCSQEGNTKSFSPHIHKYDSRDNSIDNVQENQLDRLLCAKETNVRRRLHLSMP